MRTFQVGAQLLLDKCKQPSPFLWYHSGPLFEAEIKHTMQLVLDPNIFQGPWISMICLMMAVCLLRILIGRQVGELQVSSPDFDELQKGASAFIKGCRHEGHVACKQLSACTGMLSLDTP